MGFIEQFLDDVSLKRKIEDKKIGKTASFNLKLTAKNKRFGVTLKNVDILQLIPSWFDVNKRPKEVIIEGKTYKMMVWQIPHLKPREQKTITISISGALNHQGELGTAHASYKKVRGKHEKQVYDGFIAGPKKVY